MCITAKNFKHVLISALSFLIISQVINTLGAIFTMSYYTDPKYFSLWSKLMMPSNGPPGIEFFLASVVISLITGFIFAGAYSLLKPSIPGEGFVKGIKYGALLFMVVGIPFTLTTYLLFAVPSLLLLDWTVSTLVIYLVSGAVFARIMGEK